MYLLWFDDNRKHDIAHRVRGAIEAYTARFKCAPDVVMMSADDLTALNAPDVDGVAVKAEAYIRSCNYWAGMVK